MEAAAGPSEFLQQVGLSGRNGLTLTALGGAKVILELDN